VGRRGPHPWPRPTAARREFASMDGRYVVWASRMRPNVYCRRKAPHSARSR
jgi:hypothetical protein